MCFSFVCPVSFFSAERLGTQKRREAQLAQLALWSLRPWMAVRVAMPRAAAAVAARWKACPRWTALSCALHSAGDVACRKRNGSNARFCAPRVSIFFRIVCGRHFIVCAGARRLSVSVLVGVLPVLLCAVAPCCVKGSRGQCRNTTERSRCTYTLSS